MMRKLGIVREGDGQWVDAILAASQQNLWAHERDMAADRMRARKMQGIVDKEMALALKEGQVVIRGRRGHPLRKNTKGR